MASSANLMRGKIMLKFIPILLLAFVFIFNCQNGFAQKNGSVAKTTTTIKTASDNSGFYSSAMLESDFKQVDVVAYVNIKNLELIDSLGDVDCENNQGGGLCLYLLKADVKEVYKGKITEKTIEFYISPDADYPKSKLLGERVVFLNKGSNFPNNKEGLGTLENSTRSIEHGVLNKMRKIAKKVKSK